MSGTDTPVPGQSFMIISNDSTDPVNGTFAGLPDGALIPNFLGSALTARIFYSGGDGNDVVIRVLSTPTAAATGVSGRVTDANGRGIRNARIFVAGMGSAEAFSVVTGPQGYYFVPNLVAGRTYVITVNSFRHQFGQPSKLVTLSDSIAGVDWVAEP
ncbi:MAG: carboxypeptidase regulatory-like domain-containing protein [Acidobacteria bacterium]|nr:carboxypeptidase regulatory-like domain-containing protein [Acidobacteriota bacterium]